MSDLSDNALRVLRNIRDRGLVVIWRHRVPRPYYGDGERFPEPDWQVVEQELGRICQRYVGTGQITYTAWDSDWLYTETDASSGDYVADRYLLTDQAVAMLDQVSSAD